MISGDLGPGYIFDDHNSNQYVPIVKFQNAEVRSSQSIQTLNAQC